MRNPQPITRYRSACAASVVFALVMLLTAASRGDDRTGPDDISFGRDVMAVLSKAGCNMGTCHGNANGKGGFRLSLRGDFPDDDYHTLTRDALARRVDPLNPDASLLLRKATTQLAHDGGKRFDVGSPEYRILRAWIARGMPPTPDDLPALADLSVSPNDVVLVAPDDALRVGVTATFADGSIRDVTRMAVYEPTDNHTQVTADGRITRKQHGETTVIVRYLHMMRPVRVAFIPARPGFTWADPPTANAIDEHVFAKLRRLRVNPSSLCDDATFIRRASLDICGVIPTAAEARAFVDDPRPDKRARLIDTLMQRPEFADHWALKWADLLRNEEKVLDSKGVSNFHHWIRASIVEDKPLDVFARELLTARGSTYANPPANYYRAMRTTTARSEATAQLFLGTRLSCAKCHSHPFEKWTQDDYYGFAALFAGVEYKILENRRRDKNDKNQFIGEQVVWVDPGGTIKDPRNGRPADPRLLGDLDRKVPHGAAGLDRLAEWMTSPDTEGGRLFARVLANRIWEAMTGRGVVEPIDDFRATNPPSNPALLDTLTAKLIDSGYDLRAMIRFIADSRVYQLAATPNDTNAEDHNFSRAIVRRLTAEQLIDSMAVALDTPTRFNGFDRPLRAAELPGVNAVYRDRDPSPADRFVKMFGKPPRLTSCACERTEETALNQVFELTSGELINELLTASGNRLDTLLKSDTSDERVVSELYWAILTRAPTDAELRASSSHIGQSSNRRTALEDVAWSLLNAKAFLLRH